MKPASKLLCIALLGLLTASGAAQSLVTTGTPVASLTTTPRTPPSDVVTGTLVMTENSSGWVLSFTNMGNEHTMLLLVGLDVGPGYLAFDSLGFLPVDVTGLFFASVAGTTTKHGDVVISLDRPKTLDPILEGFILAVQGVSVDPRRAKTIDDLKTSNADKIVLVSSDRY